MNAPPLNAPSEAASPRPGRWRPGHALALAALVACAALAAGGCSDDANPLAPYEGQRPLDLLRVTQSFTPQLQWVGGRVAAVGVNRGTRAALDSTLVWMMTAPGDDISSFVTVGEGGDDARVMSYGGTPQDRLTDGQTYTFWLAEQSALDAGLDSTHIEAGAFADTTMAVHLLFCGQQGGGAGVTFEIERDERLTGEQFYVRWTPDGVRFNRLAIREAPVGGFTDLTWFVLTPDGEAPSIASPVTIGAAPPGTEEPTPFADFVRDDEWNPPSERDSSEVDVDPPTYTLWATTEGWNESFAPTAPGYAWFRIDKRNFDIDEPCP